MLTSSPLLDFEVVWRIGQTVEQPGAGRNGPKEKCVEKDTDCRGIVSGTLRGFAGTCRSKEGRKGIVTGPISCLGGGHLFIPK